MGSKQLHFLNTEENHINNRIFEIEKSIENLNEQLDSNDFWLFISYKSINAEFREMSEQIAVSLLRVSYRPIDTNVLSDESGIFSKFTLSLKKQCQFKDNPNKAPPPQEKVLLKDPR